MSYITANDHSEMVPDLRAMARVEASAEVRAALIRLADRYAAWGNEAGDADQGVACAYTG